MFHFFLRGPHKHNLLEIHTFPFGCGFFAYNWKLPAYSGAFLLTVDNFSFFTYSWAFLLTVSGGSVANSPSTLRARESLNGRLANGGLSLKVLVHNGPRLPTHIVILRRKLPSHFTNVHNCLERCQGLTHKGLREKVLKVMNFRVFSGYFQGVFRVFQGVFRVFFPMPFAGMPFEPVQIVDDCAQIAASGLKPPI